MRQIDVSLEQALDEAGISEAAYWMHFAAPEIAKFLIDPIRRDLVHVWVPDGADAQRITRKVQATIREFASSSSHGNSVPEGAPQRRIGSSRKAGREGGFRPEDAIAAGIVKPLGLADLVISEPLTTLIRGLDRAFLGLAAGYEAREQSYSSLLPISYLERLRYFDSFPQNIMFPSVLRTDIDAAMEFIKQTKEQHGQTPRDFHGFADRTHMLAPAACFHVYHGMQNEVLAADQVITTLGRCYRYESRNASLMERLWDFTMREVVFLGEEDHVRQGRESSLDLTIKLAEEWGLSGVIEAAHDPFFMRGGRDDYELRGVPKYELRLDLPYKGGDFACASFNVHGTFFGSGTDICMADGATAWTGCTAFGVERWAWAIVAQHGVDPTAWPSALQNLMTEVQI